MAYGLQFKRKLKASKPRDNIYETSLAKVCSLDRFSKCYNLFSNSIFTLNLDSATCRPNETLERMKCEFVKINIHIYFVSGNTLLRRTATCKCKCKKIVVILDKLYLTWCFSLRYYFSNVLLNVDIDADVQ